MIKYKQKLIDKVLFHDLQSTKNNNTRPAVKSRNDKDSKKPAAKGVVKQR